VLNRCLMILLVALLAVSLGGASDIGTRENPIPIGTAFELDNGWNITVMSVIPNANSIIQQENMFNPKPESGNQYFLAMIEAKNNGNDVDKLNSYYFNVVGASAVAYEGASVVPPNPLPFTDVFPGGVVEGYMCWEIKSKDANSLTMYHSGVKPYVFFSLKP
jgi:hypothetical protein